MKALQPRFGENSVKHYLWDLLDSEFLFMFKFKIFLDALVRRMNVLILRNDHNLHTVGLRVVRKTKSVIRNVFQAEPHLHFSLGRGGGHLTPGVVVSRLHFLLQVVLLLPGREGEHALQLAVHQLVLVCVLPLQCKYKSVKISLWKMELVRFWAIKRYSIPRL